MTPLVAADVALLGLPAAGKTSYLAALYNSLDDPTPGAPSLHRLPTTRAYLEEIRDAWLEGRPVGRTLVGGGELVELELEAADGEVFSLRVPDVSGESFTDALVSREIDSALVDAVRDSGGVIIFTHPANVQHRISIAQALESGFLADGGPHSPHRDFDAAQAPTETQLVDLLQWAVLAKGGDLPLRVSVVLSAWDELGSVTPRQWLAQLPLLRQYLSNSPDVDARVFGVSAQGGQYGGEDDPVTILPAERSFVVTEEGAKSGNISLPLMWAARR